MRDILRLLHYIRPYLGRLVVAVLSAAMVSICYVGLISLIQPIFDEARSLRMVPGPA